MRILFVGLILTLLPFRVHAENDTLDIKVTNTNFGDFFISNKDYVHGSILHVKFLDSTKVDFPQSDSSVTIVNKNGKVLFNDHYRVDGTMEYIMLVDTVSVCSLGTLIAYYTEDYPNYGNCTSSVQYWGFNEEGEFVPFTGFIEVCGNRYPKVKWIRSQLNIGSDNNEYDCPIPGSVLFPYITAIHETGYCGVTVIDYYKMNLNGLKQYKNYSAETINQQPIFTDDLQYKTIIFNDSTIEATHLDFYSKPYLSSLKKTVNFKRNNIVKFLFITSIQSNYWICVRINGVEGYMFFQDLEKLGFEYCD